MTIMAAVGCRLIMPDIAQNFRRPNNLVSRSSAFCDLARREVGSWLMTISNSISMPKRR